MCDYVLCLNPFYSGLYFQHVELRIDLGNMSNVSIPSIQVCISNLNLEISKILMNGGLNPFYSGLYFQRKKIKKSIF